MVINNKWQIHFQSRRILIYHDNGDGVFSCWKYRYFPTLHIIIFIIAFLIGKSIQ